MDENTLTPGQIRGLKILGVFVIIAIFAIAGGFGNARNTDKNDSKKYNMSWGIYIVGAFLFGISMAIIWWLTKDTFKADLNTGFNIPTLSIWYIFLFVIIILNLLFSLNSYFFLRNRVFEQCQAGEYRNIVE